MAFAKVEIPIFDEVVTELPTRQKLPRGSFTGVWIVKGSSRGSGVGSLNIDVGLLLGSGSGLDGILVLIKPFETP